MTKPETFNKMAQLRDSGFGCPKPRHGLKLLYWFANEGMEFDDNNIMTCNYDPSDGDYGFHLFENRRDPDGDQLLPDVSYEYYEVGNLNKPEADELPNYVRKYYTREHNESNRDRIIVSFDDENDTFDKVYVTEHHGQSQYKPDSTYCISRGLLKIIQTYSLEKFLTEAGYA